MRALLAVAATLLLPLAAAGAQAPEAGVRYTPEGVWENDRNEVFYERWFGQHLRAMDEPILRRREDLGRFRRRFRMLVLPSFSRPHAVRVDVRRTGDALVRVVELTGAGGYEPGRIGEERRFHLDRDDVEALFGAIRRSGLRELDADYRDHEGPICLDGTQFVFELAEPDGARFVTRHGCHLDDGLESLIRTVALLREP